MTNKFLKLLTQGEATPAPSSPPTSLSMTDRLAKAQPPLWEPYHASITLGGLFLTVFAPCGCSVNYGTRDLDLDKGFLDVCETAECDFQWAPAKATAQMALAGYAQIMEDLTE